MKIKSKMIEKREREGEKWLIKKPFEILQQMSTNFFFNKLMNKWSC